MEVECIGNTQIIRMEETRITQRTIRLVLFYLFATECLSALIRMTIPGTIPALFCRKYLKKGSTFLNAFHLHGNMMWHTGGRPPLVRPQLV